MLVKVKKIIFYGIKDQLDSFFKSVQEEGFIEFISRRKKIYKLPDELKSYLSAIKILKQFPRVKQADEILPSKIIVNQILELNNAIQKYEEEKRILKLEISIISPFGNFSVEDVLRLEKEIHRVVQFFTIKRTKKDKTKLSDDLIYIASAFDLDYFIAINKERKTYPNMIEVVIQDSLDFLKEKEILIDKKNSKAHTDLLSFCKYLEYLTKDLSKEFNISNLNLAKSEAFFELDRSIFYIEGYVPKNKMLQLEILLKSFSINYAEITFEKNDKIPTYLENKNLSKIGEDLVNIYDIPAYTDKDPSLWVLIFFAIFFAVIISDAGYGFVYLLIGVLMHRFVKIKSYVFQRFIKLTYILSISTIIWGILTGTFFGIGFDYGKNNEKFILINYFAEKKAAYHIKQKDDVYKEIVENYPIVQKTSNPKEFLSLASKVDNNIKIYEPLEDFKKNVLLEFSLFIGVIHISFSLLRYFFRNFPSIGWVIFMIGGYLYFPSIVDATSFIHFLNILQKPLAFQIGEILLFSGLSIALILALIQKKLKGFIDLTNMIQIFADVLSYLRLYALALAGMIMAETFNNLGLKFGIGIGFIIIIFGHIINLILCVMGGVIHGLRLNFIEWYHYCFEGDGKLFNPLKLFK